VEENVSTRYLRARDIAERLDLSVDTVLRWSRTGRLPAGFRLASGVLRWDEAELDVWLEERREVVTVAPEAYSPDNGARAPSPLQIQRPSEQEGIDAS